MNAWDRFWHAPGPAHNLAVARVILAMCACVALAGEHPARPGALLHDVGALPRALWEPVGLLALLRADPPSQGLVDAVGAVAVASAVTTGLGIWTRVSTALLATSMAALLGWSQCWGRVVHDWNLVVVLWFALALAPAGASWSWDARGRLDPSDDGACTWGVRLLRLNVAMMWLLAGLNKVFAGGTACSARPTSARSCTA
ncbi:MAG TPA: hypothetical protein PKA64_18800 [Myxococcota bacterium]|nr:hypothetical protein [Myxococcota bacterium]